MEINKRIVWKDNLDNKIVSDKLLTPNPGVAYVMETDKVYFNNVVLPQRSVDNNHLESEDLAL